MLEINNYNSTILHNITFSLEKDENLSLSLTHFITNETGVNSEEGVKTFLKNAGEVLKSLGKGLSIDAQILKFDLGNVINSEEEYYKKEAERNDSRYNKTKEFKEKFKKIEHLIIKKTRKKRVIVFIDDLDRCEPENVLNLISAIKLFFTYSNDVIFMFGCDKDAIAKSVQHKYGDVINADEYLEKVIDLSFSMPNDISIHKLLSYYFPGETAVNNDNKNNGLFLQNLFKTIGFTNPRQLKKVLNKYEIICNFKKQVTLSSTYRDLIPNIIVDNHGDLMETVFTLYFIILNEFYPETFSELLDFEKKLISYANSYIETNHRKSPNSGSLALSQGKIHLKTQIILNDLQISFDEIIIKVNEKGKDYKKQRFNLFLTVFTPNINAYQVNINEHGIGFIDQFVSENNSLGNRMTLNFCKFLVENQANVLAMKSQYKMINFFKMCQTLL